MAFFSHTLQSSNQVISSGDVVGILAYAASNESSNGDARLISGSIESVAEGDFTAVSNPASLVFSTSVSADAVEQMRLTSEGYLGINTQYPTSELHVAGDARVDSMGINTAPSATHNLKVVDSKILGGIIVEGLSFPGYSIETNGVNSGMYANSSGQLLFNADFGSSNSSAAVQLSVQNTVRLEVDTTGVTINGEYKLPLADGTSGQVIKTDGNGNLSFQDDTTGSLSGAGVADYVARWSDTDTLTTGVIYDDNANVGIGTTNPSYKLDVINNARVGDIIIGDTAYTASSSYQGITHNAWAADSESYMMISDGNDTLVSSNRNTVIRCNENDGTRQIQITPIFTQIRQDNNYVAFRTGSTKFNENSNNVDFMVHGDTKLNMIYVDASADKVAIGTSTPTESLTVNGGLENLLGWKWFASSGSTTGQGPSNGFLLELNEEYGSILSKAYHYIVRLSTNSTGTDTGASYLIWWNNGAATWDIRPIGQANNVSNHPMVEVTNDGTYDRARVYTDNATPYPIRCQVESLFHGDPDCKPHSMGADYHWQRLVDDLYHTEGNVGIGISTPALQSAGQGLHIDANGFHSEIKFTNFATGAAATQGVALVASNSSFTINNRSAGEVNINTNNTNAISINSAQEVDVKKLLKVRLGNTAGATGTINRVSYYDDGAGTKAGVGMSGGSVDYVATGAIRQSFYTDGERLLRLDSDGKIVAGRDSNLVIGSPAQNGNIGIGGDASLSRNVNISKVAYNGVSTTVGINHRLTAPSGGALNAARGIYNDFVLQDGVDISSTHHFTMGTLTRNGDAAVATCIGYYVNNDGLVGSSSNYGIYSDVAQTQAGVDAEKWGLFLAGTAPNYYRAGLKTSLTDGRHGSDNLCERVSGGYKALGNTSTNAGYLKIRLPEYLPEQKAGSTMLMFDVSMYEYKTGSYKNFHFGGYVYWNTSVLASQWINTTATMEIDNDVDNANPWVVRFAIDEDDYPCVLIGRSGENEATNWQYGQVYLQNVRTGFGRTSWDQWSQNWEISLETRDTTTGGYYNVSTSYINKPIMQNQSDYLIYAGGTGLPSQGTNVIRIDGTNTVFNETGNNVDFRVEGDTITHLLFVDASADSVGVGAVNPTNKLDVYTDGTGEGITIRGNNAPGIKLWDQTLAGGGSRILEQNSASVSGQLIIDADYNNVGSESFIDFRVGNDTKMVVQQTGNIGIGTSSPSEKLEVNGAIVLAGMIKNVTAASTAEWLESTTNSVQTKRVTTGGNPSTFWEGIDNQRWRIASDQGGYDALFDVAYSTGYVNIHKRLGIGTASPLKPLHVNAVGNGAGTHTLLVGDDDSYMSIQNNTRGDYLKLGNIYTTNTYMGLSHSDIGNTGYMIMSDGNHTFVGANSSGRVYLRGGKNDPTKGEIRLGDQLVQVNPSMQNVDFIVYGDALSQLFRTDASKDSVLIGASTDGGVNSRLYIYDDGTAKTNVTNSRTLQVQGRAYTTQSGTHYHIGGLLRAEKWISGGATDTGYVIGLNAVPVVYSDSDDGANSLNEVTAIRANMSINSSLADGVNITNAYDIKCIPSLAGTNSTVTNHYGIYLTSATNGATTVTNAYGVFQEDDDASNRFAGDMTIGSTVAPDSFDGLTVYGNISAKRQDGKVMAKDSTVVNKLQASTGAGGGIVGTESNHDLIIRTNNIDRARFLSSGGFQVGKGINSFATPEGLLDVRGSAYFQTEVDSEALTFKKIPPSAPYTAQSVQEFQVGTLDDSLYLYHAENPAISGGGATEVTCAIRMTQGKISMNAPPVGGLGISHFPKFTIDTNSGRCTVEGDTLQIAENKTPSSSSDTGTKGDISWDDNYVYVCVSTNTWKRTAISTW